MPQSTRPALALASMLVVQMLASLVLTAPPVLAPAIAPMLGFAPERVGLFVGLAYSAAMLSGLWSGQGVARLGAVRLSQAAMLACALGAIAATMAHPVVLLASAAIIGAGYGVINPASATLLIRHSPPSRQGLFFSLKQAGVPLGVALAGLLLPWGLAAFGWRAAVAAAGVSCAALAVALVPAIARLEARRHSPAPDPADPRGVPSQANGAAALWSVLRDPPLRRLSLVSLTFACTQLAFVTFLVSLLNLQLGHSLAWSAGVLAGAQAVSTASRIAWGYIGDRWIDTGKLLGTLGIAMGASCIGLSLVDRGTGAGWILAATTACAATAMGWNGVFFAELTRTAAKRADLATVAGASQFFTFAGSMSGPVLFSEIVRAGGSYSLGFALLAMLPATAGVVMLRETVRAAERAVRTPVVRS